MESLRVLPPVPLTLRVARTTDYVGDILVPKGTEVMIPVCPSISAWERDTYVGLLFLDPRHQHP